jgi:hypothetical protein
MCLIFMPITQRPLFLFIGPVKGVMVRWQSRYGRQQQRENPDTPLEFPEPQDTG